MSAPPGKEPPRGRTSAALRAYERVVHAIATAAMCAAAALILIDLTLIGAGIVMRYVVNRPIVWSDELVALSLTAIVMLSAPKVLLLDQHIEVDILTANLAGRARALVRIWSALAVLAVAALLILNGLDTVKLSRLIRLVTEGSLQLPVWKLQLLLPFGGALLALAGIARLWGGIESFLAHPGDEA